MTAPNEETPAALGLRDRRRRETCRELAAAATDLFELQGVHGTTVDEIAHAAGISSRTFFRYADTKENAVFVDDRGGEELVVRVRREVAAGNDPIATIEQAQLDLLDAFDAQPTATHAHVLRVRRLVISEPSLLAVALARDEESVAQLTAIVVQTKSTPTDELRARVLVTAVGTAMRLAFDEWARRSERGEETRLRGLYEVIRADLSAFFSGQAPTN
ncbi:MULTISPECIES: TetR family transcriptional regulator [unclassified Microbacterium]|uniref:TetR family transcriptional regulator n=1 Tax=unclassified Microbacterium TaxID=2609290 RepID=UPI000EA9BC79|nr:MULTISPECIES: TetR family transcriptional regulator [unclassified Microbacterium]MBT2486516.1 TetR family transcriptional regulator [Microbacterium sp. ISL-108]RKN69212.1 TetR family transcriptional regulator [Microbacterium sp. CGR2]